MRIGAERRGSGWVWVHDSSPVTWAAWNLGEPSSHPTIYISPVGNWFDGPSDISTYSLCETVSASMQIFIFYEMMIWLLLLEKKIAQEFFKMLLSL